MQIKKIILETVYLQTLKEFYSSILELPANIHNEELRIGTGETELIFRAAKKGEPFYHFAINIPANKIEEAKTWLENKVQLLWMEDYQSDIADFVTWKAKSVYFFDPAGNILELIARFDLDNKSAGPFSSREFLSVSEIGLVFNEDEFDKRTAGLLSSYDLSWFSKQPPLPKFKAVGDDEGLFIVVPEHRNWYPTDKPAGIFPMTVEFEHDRKLYSIHLNDHH